jgi:GNAT superfamily N-acetyltransferase
MVGGIATRRGTVDDVDTILANVQSGFDSYVAFAPLGWVAPDATVGRDRTGERLADPRTWAMLALSGGSPVGHIAFVPGRERSAGEPRRADAERELIPALCHLWQLFVLPEWWGRGVAPLLHDAATGVMRAQGYARARLLTPSLHARARRFYERRGWTVTGEEWSEDLTLMLTEYRLVLA